MGSMIYDVAKKKLLAGFNGHEYIAYLEGPEILIGKDNIKVLSSTAHGIPIQVDVPAQQVPGQITGVKLFYDNTLLLQGPIMWPMYEAGSSFSIILMVAL